MAITTHDLFDLIQSMSKAEKGYFKKFSSGYRKEKDKHYIRLFHLLDKQKACNENTAIKLLRRKGTKINYPALRKYLCDLLLKSMRSYYSETSLAFRLRELLSNIEILNAKGLTHLSREQLKEGLSITEAEEIATYHILFQYAHRQLLWHYQEDEKLRVTNEIDDSVMKNATSIIQYEQLYRIMHRSTHLSNTYFPLRDCAVEKEAEALLKKLLQFKPEYLFSFVDRNAYHMSHANLYLLKGDFTRAIIHQIQSIAALEEQAYARKRLTKSYLSSLYNLANLYLLNEDNVNIRKMLLRINNVTTSTPAEELHKKTLYYLLWLDYANSAKRFDDLKPLLPALEKFISQHNEVPLLYYDTQFRLAVYFFSVKNPSRSLYYLNQVLNAAGNREHFAFTLHCHLLNILVHYELGNYSLVDNRIRSTIRYLAKHELQFTFEKELLKFFTRLLKVREKDEMLSLFTQLHNRIQFIKKDPAEKLALWFYYDYADWLNEKIRNAASFKWWKKAV